MFHKSHERSFSTPYLPQGLARFILVLQKHPKLVTYKAQAYHVKCTYNTGEKTITIGFNVSMLTTAGTIANTGPPPTCLMKITDPSGGPIDKAEIGDLLMLRIQVEPSSKYLSYSNLTFYLAILYLHTAEMYNTVQYINFAWDPLPNTILLYDIT